MRNAHSDEGSDEGNDEGERQGKTRHMAAVKRQP
jgi:hypothetical protein